MKLSQRPKKPKGARAQTRVAWSTNKSATPAKQYAVAKSSDEAGSYRPSLRSYSPASLHPDNESTEKIMGVHVRYNQWQSEFCQSGEDGGLADRYQSYVASDADAQGSLENVDRYHHVHGPYLPASSPSWQKALFLSAENQSRLAEAEALEASTLQHLHELQMTVRERQEERDALGGLLCASEQARAENARASQAKIQVTEVRARQLLDALASESEKERNCKSLETVLCESGLRDRCKRLEQALSKAKLHSQGLGERLLLATRHAKEIEAEERRCKARIMTCQKEKKLLTAQNQDLQRKARVLACACERARVFACSACPDSHTATTELGASACRGAPAAHAPHGTRSSPPHVRVQSCQRLRALARTLSPVPYSCMCANVPYWSARAPLMQPTLSHPNHTQTSYDSARGTHANISTPSTHLNLRQSPNASLYLRALTLERSVAACW